MVHFWLNVTKINTMNNSFISLVNVIQHPYHLRQLQVYLENVYPILKEQFSDFEIVLVNNSGQVMDDIIQALTSPIKQHIFLLNLSTTINSNNAIIAGLDRSNGDYTLIFEFEFMEQAHLILDLYEKTQEGHDMVYLRAKERKSSGVSSLFYPLFYFIFKHYSDLKIDDRAHHTRIISRRALNSILRLRENLRYMKAIYSIVGYHTTAIDVNTPLYQNGASSFSEQFRTSLVAITSFTTFLRSLLLWIFLFSIGFLLLVIYNAFKVRLTNIDIFGTYHETLSGWAFLVVIISIFFAITCLNLYIMSIYLSNIYYEIKQRPLYIIESVKRF